MTDWKKNEQEWMGDAEMTQEEMDKILEAVESSADQIEVPAALEPEAVKSRLRDKKRRFSARRITEIAAAVALVIAVGGSGIYGMSLRNNQSAGAGQSGSIDQQLSDGVEAGFELSAAKIDAPVAKTAVVGDYRLAESYEDVYAAWESQKEAYEAYNYKYGIDDAVSDILSGAIIKEEMIFNSVDSVGSANSTTGAMVAENGASDGMSAGRDSGANVVTDLATAEDLAAAEPEEVERDSAKAENSDFSKTNTQVEGVDESDFIKNDGSYLYVQSDYKVSIVDIRGDKMHLVAAFTPEMGASDTIRDMYVDKDQLYMIIQKRNTTMEGTPLTRSEKMKDAAYAELDYYINTDTTMELQTYDIANRGLVKLLGKVDQDGSYFDSRKVGDYIYLLSRKDMYDYAAMNTGADGDAAGIIPCVNGEKVAADCIYVKDYADNQLIISSVYAGEPEKTVDQMVLMNTYAQIYMSTEAIYLYSEDYDWSGDEGVSYTDIVKFSYKNGKMNGTGATSVRGTIQDVFAISESNGILRVLTTDWSGNSHNQLYLLDEKLNVKGSLMDIATGEEIYAARYIGNIAYFITYHNTDPLFAVDISDPTNPKMLGQVEITGFSDYLHPYGDGLLLGIGYETDPDTSQRLGVKLVMFDISDPTKLKVVDSVTFDGDYCSAAGYYKSAFVSASKNLIGFEISDYKEGGDQISYKLYAWDGSKFVKRLSESIDPNVCWDVTSIRGLYAGEHFYLVSQKEGGYKIQSYDMSADYKSLDKLVVE